MATILDAVALTTTGAYPTTTYRQRLELNELWERGAHEAQTVIDCDHQTSANALRNILGTVWHNRDRNSGVSRVIPDSYPFRRNVSQTQAPSNFTVLTQSNDYGTLYQTQIRAYGRPWYAYKAESLGFDGTPIQWNATSLAAATASQQSGDMRIIGKASGALTANELSGASVVAPGLERYRIYYKPQRFMVRADVEMDALPGSQGNSELGRYVIRDFRFAGRALTLPFNFLYWQSSVKAGGGLEAADRTTNKPVQPIPEGPTKIFPCLNLLYTWVDVPFLPLKAITNALGKTNKVGLAWADNTNGYWDYQGTMDSGNWPLGYMPGYPPGTLLFDGTHDVVEHTNSAGQRTFDITYSFVYRNNGTLQDGTIAGHNYLFRFETGQFEKVVTLDTINQPAANQKGLYDETDFDALFRLPIA